MNDQERLIHAFETLTPEQRSIIRCSLVTERRAVGDSIRSSDDELNDRWYAIGEMITTLDTVAK